MVSEGRQGQGHEVSLWCVRAVMGCVRSGSLSKARVMVCLLSESWQGRGVRLGSVARKS